MSNQKEIPGWYDWDLWNQQIVAGLPDGAVYVEVGCFLGRSTAALAGHIAASGKRIKLVVVDTFALKPGDEPALFFALGECGGGETVKGQVRFRKVFEANLAAAGFKTGKGSFIQAHTKPSVAMAAEYADGSVDVVFIDADHSYEAVVADIKAWWPKLKPGGVLAGHDIHTYDTVHRAVADTLKAFRILPEQNLWVCNQDARTV